MAGDNLDELKKELYEAFRVAIKYGKDDLENYKTNESHQAGASSLQAAAEVAKAIAIIDREQREAKDRGYNKLEKN
jgi:rRNA-processing protein FCF1